MTISSESLQRVREYLLSLQDRIVTTFERLDGKAFVRDAWERPAGGRLEGDGCSRLVEDGGVFERGGCNFSHVKGKSLPPSATAHRPELAGAAFEAMGVSLVFHPRNPHAPTVHMNVRLFAALPEGGEPVVWFGGGMDLTPYYGNEDDVRQALREMAVDVATGKSVPEIRDQLQQLLERVELDPEDPAEVVLRYRPLAYCGAAGVMLATPQRPEQSPGAVIERRVRLAA